MSVLDRTDVEHQTVQNDDIQRLNNAVRSVALLREAQGAANHFLKHCGAEYKGDTMANKDKENKEGRSGGGKDGGKSGGGKSGGGRQGGGKEGSGGGRSGDK